MNIKSLKTSFFYVLCLAVSAEAQDLGTVSNPKAGLTSPKYLYNLPSGAKTPKIYHAFDIPYAKPVTILGGASFIIGQTFPGESTYAPTSLMDSNYMKTGVSFLQTIANRGYTHIQISSPCQSVPTTQYNSGINTQGNSSLWALAYQPYICNLSYQSPGQTQPDYQKDLNDAFTALGKSPIISNYGLTVSQSGQSPITIGYRLGSDRYGSAKDLVDLIKEANKLGIGIIADVVFHQVGIQNPYMESNGGNYDSFGSHEWAFYAVNCPSASNGSIQVRQKQLDGKKICGQIAGGSSGTTQNPGGSLSSFIINSKQLTNYQGYFTPTYVDSTGSGTLTDFIIPFESSTGTPTTSIEWNAGAPLRVTDPNVQKMMAGYLQLLADIGVVGIRIDNVKGMIDPTYSNPNNPATSVLEGILSTPSHGGSNPCKSTFQFGYGEDWDQTKTTADIVKSEPLLPLEDFPLYYTLASCFANGGTVKNLTIPYELSVYPSVEFSVVHDTYPQVTWQNLLFYNNLNPDDSSQKRQSMLAIAYICSRQNAAPFIIRFEDERDSDNTIKRALAFRTLMDQADAPQEYIVAVNDDVLIIDRGSGFAVINKHPSNAYPSSGTIPWSNILNAISRAGPAPATYKQYVEILGLDPLTTGTGTVLDTRTCVNNQGSSLNPWALTPVPPLQAKFFLKTTTDTTGTSPSLPSSYNLTFRATCNKTIMGQNVYVVGNCAALGNWAPLASNILSGTGYPNWLSSPLSLPAGTTIQYKFLIADSTRKIIKWETGANRSYKVTGDATLDFASTTWP